jgi:hypothetical protein
MYLRNEHINGRIQMEKGKLTPRSADVIEAMRFSGAFGQPDGFDSVLTATVRRSGGVCFTLDYRIPPQDNDMRWSVELTNEQRAAMAEFLGQYKPTLCEKIPDVGT